jgi:molybdate transport system substrate-binding protein
MMRSFGRLLPVLAVCLLLACAPAQPSPTPASAKSAAASPATASPDAAAKPAASLSGEVTVFAAASLTDAFREIGERFQSANPNSRVTFNFGASSQLRTQLAQGAVADVFASADQAQMDRARQAGRIAGPDEVVVTNRLVVIAPRANPAGIRGPADLAKPDLKLVAAQPEVPIGVYTQDMLDKMARSGPFGADFAERANANVVSREPNVRQVVAKVQLGEADAAVVYTSDVTPQVAPELVRFDVPDQFNTLATYPIALVTGAPQAEAGRAFIDLVRSPAGQGILARWNFVPVGPTAVVPMRDADGPLREGV